MFNRKNPINNLFFSTAHLKMKTLYILFAFFIGSFTIAYSQSSTSTINLAIGKIIDAGAAGIALPDGNRVYAKKISTGLGDITYPNFGQWNMNPAETGGFLNGVVGMSNNTPGTSALTLPDYTGNKAPENFTRITNNAAKMDRGESLDYRNSIGIRLWFDNPIPDAKFLFLDIDGHEETNNREWITSFGYNGNTRVLPSTITPGNNLNTRNKGAIDNEWNVLVSTQQGTTAAKFNTISTNPSITVRKNNATKNAVPVDPDEVTAQVYYEYNQPINNFYVLWGILENADNTNIQNSGMSPFSFTISSDFGDAPDTYGTNFDNEGASHGIFAGLKLGKAVTDSESGNYGGAEADGDDATNDDEDGITTDGINSNQSPADIENQKTAGTEIIANYTVKVLGFNNLEVAAKLIGWIDWNNNGVFEADEASDVQTLSSATGLNTYTLTWTNKTLVHPATFRNHTFLRLRTTTDASFGANKPSGAMKDGEVEDYKIKMEAGPALPVTLSNFDYRIVENSNVLLEWKTLDEKLSDGFELQKSSNAINYVTVAFIKGKSNSNSVTNYSYLDVLNYLGAQNIYYRLKQIDLDGTFTMSRVITVKINNVNSKSRSIAIPTIVENGGVVQVQGSEINNLKLYDLNGRLILQKSYSDKNNNATLTIPELLKGLYLIRVNDGESIKIIVR